MGFQPLSAAPLATDWRYDSEAVLVTTQDGKVTEYALPQNTDTHHTFELKLDSREFTYKPKPSMEAGQADAEGAEGSKEEKDDGQKPFVTNEDISMPVYAKYLP